MKIVQLELALFLKQKHQYLQGHSQVSHCDSSRSLISFTESKSTWKWDDEERSLQSGEVTVEIARTHIQPMLEKLYEKKMPSEWLSKLDKPDVRIHPNYFVLDFFLLFTNRQ